MFTSELLTAEQEGETCGNLLSRECTGSRGQISNFVRRECELLAPSHQQLAGEQQPDTTIEMQPCSFGQIRRKQNAISHEILA